MGVMWPDRRRCHVQLQRCRSFVCAALRTGIVPRKHKCRAVRGVPSASALPRSSARSGGPSPCGSVLIVFSGHAEDARHPIASQEPAAETDQNPTRYPTLQPLHARGESTKTFSRETLQVDPLPPKQQIGRTHAVRHASWYAQEANRASHHDSRTAELRRTTVFRRVPPLPAARGP